MKKQYLALSLGLLFSLSLLGCSTLPPKVQTQVHQGDLKNQVRLALGQPESFGPSEMHDGTEIWIYKKHSDICAIDFRDDKVIATACAKKQSHGNPLTAFAKGFADGYNSNRSVSCTSTTLGQQTSTTCN